MVALGANPSRGPVRLALRLAEPLDVRLRVFDAIGREVATLHEGVTGSREVVWSGPVAPGVYTVHLEAAGVRGQALQVVRL